MCQTEDYSLLAKYEHPGRQDVHTYAEPSKAITTHLDLELHVDFDKKVLKGMAKYDILHNKASEIILDAKDLNIIKVLLDNGQESKFKLGAVDAVHGQALTVPLTSGTKQVTIFYETSPKSEAVQWLNPDQTADKTDPFLFTQGQAILTRTWIPCQDSPGIRITYNAQVTVPKHLMAVMSASNVTEKNETGTYAFEMKQAIPPYLIALAVGNLTYKDIGERTGVYAEASMIDKSAYEFADMEKMLIAAEELYGPYLWDRYDVIVLPPSFPFGGMENPRLTFATPTIISGDRSLTALIAHELAHSWSGNLVTNATWDDFWLNEGFTVYFERRIMEALYGKDYSNMLAKLGYQDLIKTIRGMGASNKDTHLKLSLKDRNPDDGMTDIAYEKGAYFLKSIESVVGREVFDQFLKDYFETHKFQTISTEEFINYLEDKLISKHNVDVNYKDWIYGPGLPDNCPQIESDKFEKVDLALKTYLESKTLVDSHNDWTTHEWLHFIRQLPEDNNEYMSSLDSQLNLSGSGNSEIAAAWYEKSINNGYYFNIKPQIKTFLVEVGRRKFLTPLYKALKNNDDLAFAKEIYSEARKNYHSVSTLTMDELLLN